jgi:microcin C transport system permease protein
MGTYILRRLILMIPTLIGITFLIFMLVALSPGGIGASLRMGGGQMEATNRALFEAYLEDRYGLDDPAVVQYVRWLGRISPIKIGRRDMVSPRGERLRPPKPLKEPLLWRLYAKELPTVPPPEPGVHDDPVREYRAATNNYAQKRAAFIATRTQLEEAFAAYARQKEIRGVLTPGGKLKPDALARRIDTIDTSLPIGQTVAERGAAHLAAWAAASAARERLRIAFNAKPFPEAGLAIIPGVLSVAWPDFGVSFSRNVPVLDLIGRALPVTLLLNLIAFPIIYLVAVPSGMLAATRQGSLIDTLSGSLYVALWSVPTVWAGVLAIGFLASKQYLGLFPVVGLHDTHAATFTFLPGTDESGVWHRGYLLDTLWHLCLPVACLVYTGFAVLSKQTRAAMLDNFNADYVRTAKAKGVAGKDIVLRHVFRNSLLPVITMFATIFPAMLAGSVVIEKIFTIPGMGNLILDGIHLRDRELVLANALMIGTVNLLALLLADILYAVADPRITYD